MDSIDQDEATKLEREGVEMKTYPRDKDQTDLELALMAAAARKGSPILVIAALGGRLDLTIANIMLLAHPDLAGLDVRIEDGQDELFFIHKYGQVMGAAGDRVSLLALNGPVEGVCTEKLRYPLHDEALYAEQARGVSNVMLGKHAEIWVRQGTLLCIHTRCALEEDNRKE
jgi:thiamine pyrophosphokinase